MTSEQKTTQQDVFRINSAELAARTVTGLALCFGAAVAFKFSMAAAFHVDAFLTFTECIQWLAPFGLIVALTTLAIYRRNYTLIVSSPKEASRCRKVRFLCAAFPDLLGIFLSSQLNDRSQNILLLAGIPICLILLAAAIYLYWTGVRVRVTPEDTWRN